MKKKSPTLRSLKQGTRFRGYGKDDVELICIARTRRGSSRDIEIVGHEGTFSQNGNDTVEVLPKM